MFYQKIIEGDKKVIKLLGIPIYTKKGLSNHCERKYFGGIYKTKVQDYIKRHYLLGIRIFKTFDYFNKLNEISNTIYFNTEMMLTVEKQHSKVFPQYKNKHKTGAGVLVATGPTLLHYNRLDNCIHFTVNNAYQKIKPDYWFAIDGRNISKNYNELVNSDFVKFYGQCITPYPLHYYRSDDKQTVSHISDCVIEKSINGHKFYFDHPNLNINRDIESQPLPDLGSCVFSALYFAIYTGIKRIYIVGCDCAYNGYFNGGKQTSDWKNGSVISILLKGWNIFKEYVEIFHPDVELISVNPVGLKGMFKDVYTQSYLDANPDIAEELGDDVEILENVRNILTKTPSVID